MLQTPKSPRHSRYEIFFGEQTGNSGKLVKIDSDSSHTTVLFWRYKIDVHGYEQNLCRILNFLEFQRGKLERNCTDKFFSNAIPSIAPHPSFRLEKNDFGLGLSN